MTIKIVNIRVCLFVLIPNTGICCPPWSELARALLLGNRVDFRDVSSRKLHDNSFPFVGLIRR